MDGLTIMPYSPQDSEAAVCLEEQCVQGRALVLKYRRPVFHARSEVYEDYRILCAKVNGTLVGIVAWASKIVSLHNMTIRAGYMYDLRVLPAHRRKGIAIKLMKATFDDIGPQVECVYTMIAGQNQVALNLAKNFFGMKIVSPLTYLILPVYKKVTLERHHTTADAQEIHERFLASRERLALLPCFNVDKLAGYVTSFVEEKSKNAGCSIWTNENLLAEQVVAIPRYLEMLRILYIPLRFFVRLPFIPKSGDTIRSWFLFDLYARNRNDLCELLAAVNNRALCENRQYLYVLLQNNNTLCRLIVQSGLRLFTVPYVFLAKGSAVPDEHDEIYIDIRDV